MKKFVKLFSCLIVAMVFTGSAVAYFSADKNERSSNLNAQGGQAVYATHGNNVYWLTASIDEYEDKPGNLTAVKYAQ